MQSWRWYLAAVGTGAAVLAAGVDPENTGRAASQVWPAFVLVAGLLLVGLVAASDGLFEAAGQRLAAASSHEGALFAGVAVLVVVVTAVLNLDTSVAFLTPVVVHTARHRDDRKGETDRNASCVPERNAGCVPERNAGCVPERNAGCVPQRSNGALLVSACLLLSNAGSLLLPGSNLTNLIVLGHGHLSGVRFADRMGLPWVVASVLTAGIIAAFGGRELRRRVQVQRDEKRVTIGLGAVAVAAAVVIIVLVSSPAVPVLAVGVAAVLLRLGRGRLGLVQVQDILDLPVLVGLFGVAVGLGTVGRDWSFPAAHLAHLDSWATAAVAGASTVLINNLPAASLLSAQRVAHPLALLVGLDLGPNLFVSGSLAWVLWYNAARAAGARPDVRRTVRIGLVAAPVSIVAAVAVLLAGSFT